jgi:hypothetical protein
MGGRDGGADGRIRALFLGPELMVEESVTCRAVLDAQVDPVALPADLEGRGVDSGRFEGRRGVLVEVGGGDSLGLSMGLGESNDGPLEVRFTIGYGACIQLEHQNLPYRRMYFAGHISGYCDPAALQGARWGDLKVSHSLIL